MTESTAPGGDLAATVAHALPSAPATALDAVASIRVWRDAARALSSLVEARVMEAAWTIRREYAEHGAFVAFVGARLGGVMDPERAWLMAETWDVARRNRSLRELATRRGDEAMAFVAEFVAAGPAALAALDEDRREVAEIVAAAPQRRHEMIQDLLDATRHAQEQRSPDDVREIAVLTRERDTLREQALNRRDSSGEEIRDAVADLRRVESEIAGIAGRLSEAMPGANQAHRNMVLAAGHKLREYLDAITGLAVGSRPADA